MTYCVGVKLNKGLVFMSDSLTNAGVDNLSHHKKMFHWHLKNKCIFTLLASGNLATTQSVVNKINESNKKINNKESILNTDSMYKAATIIGEYLRGTISINKKNKQQLSNNPYSATFIFGGQIYGETPKIFLIYPEGNFIEASNDEPFLQIGETKYGKPILLRALDQRMSFQETIKLLLVSFDSTIKTNLSVGLPIDYCDILNDEYEINSSLRINKGNKYFNNITEIWENSLKKAVENLPNFDFDENHS